MKAIIQRNLDLSKVYELAGVSYQSIEDGGGHSCDNCGKIITNIAQLKCEGKSYYVGLDCMDTLLEQSQNVLSWDDQFKYNWVYKAAIQKAKSLRAKILKGVKKYPSYTVKQVEGVGKDGKEWYGFRFNNGNEPLGWDYTYDIEFKELTLSYVKGLINI